MSLPSRRIPESPLSHPSGYRPGTHLTSVGYKPPRGELPRALLERGSLFVETRLAFEPTTVGSAELAGLDGGAATELGGLELGARPGRRERDEITVYKAMGHVIEDIVAADLVYRRAREQAAGHTVELYIDPTAECRGNGPRRCAVGVQ
jgi:alanine dehydrogenase